MEEHRQGLPPIGNKSKVMPMVQFPINKVKQKNKSKLGKLKLEDSDICSSSQEQFNKGNTSSGMDSFDGERADSSNQEEEKYSIKDFVGGREKLIVLANRSDLRKKEDISDQSDQKHLSKSNQLKLAKAASTPSPLTNSQSLAHRDKKIAGQGQENFKNSSRQLKLSMKLVKNNKSDDEDSQSKDIDQNKLKLSNQNLSPKSGGFVDKIQDYLNTMRPMVKKQKRIQNQIRSKSPPKMNKKPSHLQQTYGMMYASKAQKDLKKTRQEKVFKKNSVENRRLSLQELARLGSFENNSLSLETTQRGNSSYLSHKENFADLTRKDIINTEGYVVIEAIISNDGDYTVVLLRPHLIFKNIQIKIYDLRKNQTNSIGDIKLVSPYLRNEKSHTMSSTQDFTITGSNLRNNEQAFIRAIQITQSEFENVFALAYFDRGYFRIRVFDIVNNCVAQIDDINKMINVSNKSIPVKGFNHPNITVNFCNKSVLFVNIFYSVNTSNIHFFYNFIEKKIVGEVVSSELKCSPENFPVSLFKNDVKNEMYQLYRHGQFVTITYDQYKNYSVIQNQDVYQQQFKFSGIGESTYIKNSIIAVHCANQIIFFKRSQNSSTQFQTSMIENTISMNKSSDQKAKQSIWDPYHRLTHQSGCRMFYSQNTSILICVSLDRIFFYKINSTTFIPELEQQMFNFMSCNRMIQGPKNRVAITYRLMQEDLIVFRRKQIHKFKAEVETVKRSHFDGVNLIYQDFYIISNENNLQVYNQNTFQKQFKDFEVFPIQSTQSQTWGEFNSRILNIILSQSEKLMLVISGLQTIDDIQVIHKLHILEVNQIDIDDSSTQNADEQDALFKYVKCLDLTQRHIFQKNDLSISMKFDAKNEDLIWVIDCESIQKLNYKTNEMTVFHKFEGVLQRQPDQFQLNYAQDVAFVVAGQDSLFVHINDKLDENTEVDFDLDFLMLDIRCCLRANKKFYILSNRYKRHRGVFLMELDQDDPCNQNSIFDAQNSTQPKFLMKRITQLEIGDADMYFLSDKRRLDYSQTKLPGDFDKDQSNLINNTHPKVNKTAQELIISYKTIYSNTYTIKLIDLQTGMVIFRYESFHMWESHIKGILLSTNEYLTVTKESVEIMGLSSKEQKKTIVNADGNQTILHSLQECQYLKINKSNHLNFSYKTPDNGGRELEICIEDQYQVDSQNFSDNQSSQSELQKITSDYSTKFELVYKILIQDLTLNQLLLLQGLYSASSQTQISSIIQEQPNPQVFYKSLLELDMCNLVSIFSVDSKMIKAMLHQKHSKHFSSVYPIFYKVRNYDSKDKETFMVKSAIDIALESNQLLAAQEIMLHIVKYQNSFVYSFLFEQNLAKLLYKGINISPLLKSDIVFHVFSFENWPETSNCQAKITKPYNGSLFDLRNSYSDVFPKHHVTMHSHDHMDDQLHKIKYTINLLPSMADKDNIRFMDLLGITAFLDVYDSESIQNLIDFKWEQYAKWIHYLMFLNNTVFFILFMIYTDMVCNQGDLHYKKGMLISMLVSNSIYMFYDMQQLFKQGPIEYFGSFWNIMDQALIWVGYTNIYIQYTHAEVKQDELCQIIMVSLVILILVKTFFYLRIFESLTQLVIMINCVIKDLTTFMVFFVLLLVSFSLILSILGFGNFQHIDDQELIQSISQGKAKGDGSVDWAGSEYRQLPLFMSNILIILRFSLGDFDFQAVNYLQETQAYIFWLMWIVIVMMSCIIFLNFIIAEVSQSYTKVKEQVDQLILQERIKLIDESEQMMNYNLKQKNEKYFPMYLITREVEE